jgi:uncharacterized protein YcbX
MKIVELWRYPVKSMQGERVTSSAVDERGLAGDRQWAVLDPVTGATLTARRQPELLFGAARLAVDGADVALELPDGATDLTAWLGHPVELVRVDPEVRARYEIATDFEAEDTSEWVSWQGPSATFHDSGSINVSILSSVSMRDWAWRRFRANVVVDAEETGLLGHVVRIGDVEAKVSKPISRCVMTTRPQPGGIGRDLDVLRTINRECGGNLGIGLRVTRPGTISEGDVIEVVG